MSVPLFSATTQQCAQQDIPVASVGHEQSFKKIPFLKMLRSGVTATFGYAAKSAIFCYSQFPVPCTCTVLTIAAAVPHIFNYVLMNIIISTHV